MCLEKREKKKRKKILKDEVLSRGLGCVFEKREKGGGRGEGGMRRRGKPGAKDLVQGSGRPRTQPAGGYRFEFRTRICRAATPRAVQLKCLFGHN